MSAPGMDLIGVFRFGGNGASIPVYRHAPSTTKDTTPTWPG